MRRRTVLALLGLCIALRAVSLIRPCLSDDEAIYATVAREMLTGHELYRDVVDHKPPAVYVVYAVTQVVGGTIGGPVGAMLMLHALLIGVVFATGLLLARLVRLHWPGTDPRAPAVAALLWIVYTTTLVDVDGLAANCELFMMLPLVGSVAVLLGARGGLGEHALVGVLIGTACLFKYQAGIQLPLVGLAVLFQGEGGVGRRLVLVGAIAVGFAAAIGFAVCWIWRGGGLDAALFWLRFNVSYIQAGSSWGELVQRLAVRGGLVVGSAVLLYGLGLAAVVAARRDPFVRFLAGWVLVSGVAVFTGGRFFGHYFHQLTAPLAVLAAPATLRLWHRRRQLVQLAIGVPAIVWFVLGALHDHLMVWYGEPDPDYARVARWLDDRGEGALCVWGNSPTLYFTGNRALGCRFVFSNYLTGLSPATATQSDASVDSSPYIVREAWPMLEHDLDERQPRFVVDGSPGDIGFYGKYPPAKFPSLACRLDRDYDAVADVAGMRIYERRAAAHGPASARTPCGDTPLADGAGRSAAQ